MRRLTHISEFESSYGDSPLTKNLEVKSIAEDLYGLAGLLHAEKISASKFKEVARRIIADTVENSELIKSIT